MTDPTERLHYLRKFPTPVDFIGEISYKGLEHYLISGLTNKYTVYGTEYIPSKGPLFLAFGSHCGSLEVLAINLPFEKKGLYPAWATRKETFGENSLLDFLIAGRHFPLARHSVHPDAHRKAVQILQKGGVVGTALEGTRGEETKNRSSLTLEERMPLNQAYAGAVQFAYRGKAPVQPIAIVGPEKEGLFPVPEEIYEKHGVRGLLRAIHRATQAEKQDKPSIFVKILPPYKDHLENPKLGHTRLTQGLQEHAHLHHSRSSRTKS